MRTTSIATLLVAATPALAAAQSSEPAAAPSTPPAPATTIAAPNIYDALWTYDVDIPQTLSVYDDGFSPADATTSTIKELDEIEAPHAGKFLMSFTDPVFDAIVGPLSSFYAQTGLRVGVAYTTVFQLGNAGVNGFSGDLDIMTAWTLVGRGTPNTGTFVFTGEDRFRQADQPASAVGPDMGTLQPTTNGFNDRGWVVRDGYWLQRLFDNRLRLLVGRADLTDFVGAHRLQNLNSSFSNRWFSANPVVASPGHGPAAGLSFAPCDWFYVSAGLANAYNTTTTIGVDTLDQGDFFYTAEVGLTPVFQGLGAGRYQLMLWRMDERPELGLPSDQGISVILNQEIGESLIAFARYGNSEATLTNVQNAVQAGVGLQNLFSQESLTGVAGSWGEPDRAGWRDETVFELFHRIQLSRYSQFTVGGQVIFDPSNSPTDSDVVGVLTMRYRVAF
ncbi:MAG: hypothetical protein JNM94_10190 [Phycisphaerae bacterium]|nr:hypothetical protein [Phycisphaerae bacterium]